MSMGVGGLRRLLYLFVAFMHHVYQRKMMDFSLVTSLKFIDGTCDDSDGDKLWSCDDS